MECYPILKRKEKNIKENEQREREPRRRNGGIGDGRRRKESGERKGKEPYFWGSLANYL